LLERKCGGTEIRESYTQNGGGKEDQQRKKEKRSKIKPDDKEGQRKEGTGSTTPKMKKEGKSPNQRSGGGAKQNTKTQSVRRQIRFRGKGETEATVN